jgi:two-component system nitrate/nitrite response regulator NarL
MKKRYGMGSQPAAVIRTLIVDDHTLFRHAIRHLLGEEPGIDIVAEVGSIDDALACAEQHAIDIMLLDIDLQGANALDRLPELQHRMPAARIIVLTGSREEELHQRAFRMGVLGLVQKSEPADTLIQAIKTVANGEAWLDRAMMARLLTGGFNEPGRPPINPEAAKIASLTDREREVIQLICEGLPNQATSARLSISEATVRHHLSSIFEKLGVSSRLELVVYAYRHELAKPR